VAHLVQRIAVDDGLSLLDQVAAADDPEPEQEQCDESESSRESESHRGAAS
jgi:hypothetical protein